MRIFVYTSQFCIGKEKQDLVLVEEFRRRGFDVTHAVPTNRMPFKHFPGFPTQLRKDKDFKKYGTKWVGSLFHLRRLINRCDVLVLLESKWAKESAADHARKAGKTVIQYKGISDFDFYDCEADLYCVSSVGYKRAFLCDDKQYSGKVVITGSLQFDLAVSKAYKADDKNHFLAKYGLDSKKKLAIWLPVAPANHHSHAKTIYKETCREALRSGYNLLIKGHPWDYIKRKTHETYADTPEKHSWEVLAPGIPVCEPQDLYRALNHCDVAISQISSICIEVPLFKKPLIYVNRYDFLLYDSHSLANENDLKIGCTGQPGWHKFDIPKKLAELAECGKIPRDILVSASAYADPKLEFIGMDVKIGDLTNVLTNNSYTVRDDKLFEGYVEKWCHKNDGMAYSRIVDAVVDYLHTSCASQKR